MSTTVSLAGATIDIPQSNEYGAWVRSNRGSDGLGVSKNSFDVSVTSSTPGFIPVIHFSSDGY
ncbi:hypothetical protein GYM75_06850 [Gilliamella sp. ESL0441]|uniref:hypothetical protein n=1 Tax=Gilliamella sp. ESL0441 TaxID=2704654 RepID=UPI001C696E90|nr:hypothetical protein [Gilliamella sp. ESL0441]QYN44572.1 hypothetical protein GYM75_06850 [Gilliamella sp. ESL0441]